METSFLSTGNSMALFRVFPAGGNDYWNLGEATQPTFQSRLNIVSTLWINVEITLIWRWKCNKIRHRIFNVAQRLYNVSARRWNNVETTLHNVKTTSHNGDTTFYQYCARLFRRCATSFQCCFNVGHWRCIDVVQRCFSVVSILAS